MGVRNFVFLVGVCFLCSCKTTKTPLLPAPERTIDEILSAIQAHNTSFYHWNASMSAEGNTPEFSGSVQLKVRMTKDSLIWVQAKKIGVEAARIRITPEKTAIIFRLERAYMEKSTSSFIGEYRMRPDFYQMQQLFIGNLPEIDSAKVNEFYNSPEGYVLSGEDDSFAVKYIIDPYTLEIIRAEIEDSQGRSVAIQFLKYKVNKQGIKFSSDRRVTIFDGQDNMYFRLETDDVEYETLKNTPFEIPSHYERVY